MKEVINKFFIGVLVIFVIMFVLWCFKHVPFDIGVIIYVTVVIAVLLAAVLFWYWYLTHKPEVKDGSEDEM